MHTLAQPLQRAILIVLAAVACASVTQAAEDRARLNDARVIVTIELAAEKTLGPCQIDGDAWMEYPVPADIARKYLGKRGSVAPATPLPSPRATLDEDGLRAGIFCSKEAGRARRDAAIAALNPGERISKVTLGYAFPVFDAAGQTAVVIVEHDVGTWRRDQDGTKVRPSGEAFGVARVYRKHGKRWHRIATEEVYSALY